MSGLGEWGMTTNVLQFYFWSDENVLRLDGYDGFITLCIYLNPLNRILQKGEFYGLCIILNKAIILKIAAIKKTKWQS